MTVAISLDDNWIGTDELTIEFYQCPVCEYERVPRAIERDDDSVLTARYCPGCGEPIVWATA